MAEREQKYRQRRQGRPSDIKRTVSELWSYLRTYPGHMITMVVTVCLSALTNVASSYFFKPIINDYVVPFIGQDNVDLSKFAAMLGFMATIYASGVISTYLTRRVMSHMTTGVLASLRSTIFAHLQDMPISYYDGKTHGEIMTYITSDVDTMRMLISQTMPMVINTLISIVGIIVVMLKLDWRLSVINIFLLIIVIFVSVSLTKLSRKYFSQMQFLVSQLHGFIEETFTGQKVVKAYQHEGAVREEFTGIVDDLYNIDIRTGFLGGLMMPINMNLSYVAYVITAVIGALLVINGKQDVGTIASFLLYARQISGPVSRMSQQFNYVMMSLAGAERVFTLIDSPKEPDEGDVIMVDAEIGEDGSLRETDHRTGVWAWKDPQNGNALSRVMGDVRFDNVRFWYVEGKVVLDGVSFYAKPGQKIAFVGSTGAGKTTITNLINRFYDIQEGSITYDGFDIKRIKKESLRRSIGMVLQDTNLFSGTVMENIRYGRLDATDEECIAAAKLANAHSFITRLPQGYQTVLEANGANLSQGQRQLLNISRAAVASPPVLVLDEATSSIDTRTEHQIEAGMDEIMKGRTVFTIAHRLSTVRGSNAIMVIEHGKIIERGSHDELVALKGRYYQLYTGTLELE